MKFILMTALLTMSFGASAAMPVNQLNEDANELNDKEIINATFLGQDDDNLFIQSDSGQGLVIPVGLRRGGGFHRVPGTNCYGASSIVYAYCLGAQFLPSNWSEYNNCDDNGRWVKNPKIFCAFPGRDPFRLPR